MRRHPRRDLVAGATVAVVALPLALAFGISSGLGAGAGMITAVVAGLLAALFGGSRVQVSGPTGAMTVVLVPIVARHGAGGVFLVGLLAGLILIGLAVVGAGRYMRYVPLPVIEGFTLGIALIIGLQQIPAALGVTGDGEKVLLVAASAVRAWFASPQWAPLLVAAAVAAAMLLGARRRPGLPISLLAVVAATLVCLLASVPVSTIGAIPSGLPAPSLPTVPWTDVHLLLLPAAAVASLAALESLLSATVSDAMSVGERHDSDRELFGQGVANVATSMFGGVPATAAIARTAVNVRSGATSRLASVVQSVLLLIVMLGASRWVSQIPLAALAGVLIATAVQMIEVSSLRAILRATRGDAVVLGVTAVMTLAFDLVTAVIVGFVVAGGFALRAVAHSARLESVPLDEPGSLAIQDESSRSGVEAEEKSLLDDHIVAYRFDGSLFFGAAHMFLLELAEVSDVRVVVLRMSRMAALDATGAAVLADTITRLETRSVTVLLSGVQTRHEQALTHLGVYDALAHEQHLFNHTPDAIAHARLHAARGAHTSST
jgi:MFS superfamily sulfate permease-like transporter